ncbi:DUF4861 domain-containing protein [Paraflavisolibacter sp. H34]|uniref:DUF4861 domain-containing protein n=1 Tax=Huijunlia imazamoxiresistens TaxID=3127457 RepID=UPI0030197EEA
MFQRLLPLALGSLLLGSLHAQPTSRKAGRQILLTNNSAIALHQKPVSLKRAQLGALPAGKLYPLVLTVKGDTLASQLDDRNGDGRWDELFFVASLPAKSSLACSLKWTARPPQYVAQTSVRFGMRRSDTQRLKPATRETVFPRDMPKTMGFQRYQTDGPSWENDKVGFRHYLDGRNSKDVFGKRISAISPENVGINAAGAVEDNYHVMEPWGRDILAVGNSIGIGGVALGKGDSLYRLGVIMNDTLNNVERTDFRIVTEGPVRSMLQFDYHNWKPAGRPYQVKETVSIWPGMYAYQNTVSVSGTTGAEELLIGLVNINAVHQPQVVPLNKDWVALVSHEKHSYNKEWWLGLALILPADLYKGYKDAPKQGQLSHTFLARLKITGRPVTYYAIAGWELSDEGFKDPAYFKKYVEDLGRQIAAPLKVSVR